MLKICIAGMGFMGKTHFDRYKQLISEGEDIELVGLYTLRVQANDGFDTSARRYDDFEKMLSVEKPDAVDICLPDKLHRECAEKAFHLGVHVLCEKPMALTEADGRMMIAAAKSAGKVLSIAHCCRYSTEYKVLRDVVLQNRLGKLNMASFHRMSNIPAWSIGNWLLDSASSGGCVVDMHVHDIDITNWLFGRPIEVSALGFKALGVSAQYRYTDYFVTLQSNWGVIGQDFPFTSGFEADFEHGTVVCGNGKTTVYAEGKAPEAFLTDTVHDGYYGEIKHFIRVLQGKEEIGRDNEQAAEAVGLARLELESIERNGAWVKA